MFILEIHIANKPPTGLYRPNNHIPPCHHDMETIIVPLTFDSRLCGVMDMGNLDIDGTTNRGHAMITKEMALSLRIGTYLYHRTLRNRDGTAMRARVNGKCKVWERSPSSFRLPMKYGLKQCFYITADEKEDWLTYDPTIRERLPRLLKLADNTPWQMVHDAAIDAGRTQEAKEYRREIERIGM